LSPGSLLGLPPEEFAAFERGVAEFNRGFFFECHDTLEDIWTGLRGQNRDFIQGLIQVSVAFYHLTNGNLGGADSMLERALKKFEGYEGRCFGFELEQHREELRSWLQGIRSGDVGEVSLEGIPKWRFEILRK
jgi:uncharacterized protein